MYPILGRYGRFIYYSYTAVLALGIVAGIGLAAWRARTASLPHWFDGLLASLAAGLVGGRLGFVWGQWSYFQERPGEMWQIWQGGLSYHGALMAGLLALWAWSRWQKRAFGRYANLLAPGFALASAFGWLACWLEGCAYGRQSAIGPLSAALPDDFGVYALRYQTQLLGLLLSLAVFFLVMGLRRRAGQVFWLALFGLSFGRVFISWLRGDPTLTLGPMRLDTFLELILAAVSLVLLKYGGEFQNHPFEDEHEAESRPGADSAQIR